MLFFQSSFFIIGVYDQPTQPVVTCLVLDCFRFFEGKEDFVVLKELETIFLKVVGIAPLEELHEVPFELAEVFGAGHLGAIEFGKFKTIVGQQLDRTEIAVATVGTTEGARFGIDLDGGNRLAFLIGDFLSTQKGKIPDNCGVELRSGVDDGVFVAAAPAGNEHRCGKKGKHHQ